jgi:glutamate-5-semialdehyde dehydrogenase
MSIILSQLQKTKRASYDLLPLSDSKINKILNLIANQIQKDLSKILKANQKDLEKANCNEPKFNRLKLTKEKIDEISQSLKNVAKLASPVSQILENKTLENGLNIQKISVPIGVIGVIYEARPNVTPDVFALAFKSKNACVLKGGSDSYNSHLVFYEIITKILKENNVNPSIICLLPPEREVLKELFFAHNLVDVIIPRGSQSLIEFVRQNCRIPVIETGAGVCHIFWEKTGKVNFAQKIILNSKTRNPAVCNSLDCLLIETQNLAKLQIITRDLANQNVEIFADQECFEELKNFYPAQLLFLAKQEDFGREFLSLKLAIKAVSNQEEALNHIWIYGSKHSECIITESKTLAEEFLQKIDAACVYVNSSTAFTDGGEFGMGCEIGISTQKLHARGPMGLKELTSYKWLITGKGQIR